MITAEDQRLDNSATEPRSQLFGYVLRARGLRKRREFRRYHTSGCPTRSAIQSAHRLSGMDERGILSSRHSVDSDPSVEAPPLPFIEPERTATSRRWLTAHRS